ncbi:MAG TPA: zinc ribbon domain-containing protein [Terracidiphilus sp.]
MPAYEYQCDACSVHFEQRQKMSDKPVEACIACGGTVHRLISGGAGAISKGSSHASSLAEAPSACSMGGPCCGGGGMCASGMGCEN